MIVPLRDARDASLHGGKAHGLSAAIAHGLPVPEGFALSPEAAALAASGELRRALEDALAPLGPVAVRSSAIGEDSVGASFAGLHATILGCEGAVAVEAAVAKVLASATTPAALAYRKKMGILGETRMAVVVQSLVDADVSAILFSRHPVTGADQLVVEATWGLGETLVQGLVNPDRFLLGRDGTVLQADAGDKDVRFVRQGGETVEESVPGDLRHRMTLDRDSLAALAALVPTAESFVGGPVDLELAFRGGRTFVLQARPITR